MNLGLGAPPLRPDDAAEYLARLMERQLGYAEGHIDPIALRLFIRAYWSRVSVYAHAIHDEDGVRQMTAADERSWLARQPEESHGR